MRWVLIALLAGCGGGEHAPITVTMIYTALGARCEQIIQENATEQDVGAYGFIYPTCALTRTATTAAFDCTRLGATPDGCLSIECRCTPRVPPTD